MSGSSTGADAQAAASAAAPAVEEDAQYWRLKDRVPGFIYELFSSQNKGAQVPGVVSLHYEDGVQLKDAGDQAFKLHRQQSGHAAGDSDSEGEAEGAAPAGSQGSGAPSHGTLGQRVAEKTRLAAGEEELVRMQYPSADGADEADVCMRPACGKSAEPGVKFPACARCGGPYCSRACQQADWPDHKPVCCPEKLRLGVPAEAELLGQIKRQAAGALVDELMQELSLAGVAWHRRLGRGLAVVYMEDLAYLASRASAAKCQVYAFYVPERLAGAWAQRVPGLQAVLDKVGGVKKLLRSIPAGTRDKHVAVSFVDSRGYTLSMGLPIFPTRELCQQVLDTGSPELREFDVLCADTVSGDMMLLDFHSVVNLALAGPPAEAAVARRPRRR